MVNYEAQRETSGIISNYRCWRMAESCLLARKVQVAFRRSGTQNLPEENYSTRHSGKGSFTISGVFRSPGKLKISILCEDAKERDRLCREEWIFQQDYVAIHNPSITNKYLLEQKVRLLDHTACSPDLNPIENLWGLIIAKVYEVGRQYLAISELKNAILDAWEKYLRFNFRN